MTVCPLCQFNLDAYQSEIRRRNGDAHLDMPVLYFTQLLGLGTGRRGHASLGSSGPSPGASSPNAGSADTQVEGKAHA